MENVFLNVWCKDQSKCSLSLQDFQSLFSLKYSALITAFFDEDVSFEKYYKFIVFFGFFDMKNIITLLLSICNIHSNLYVTRVYYYNYLESNGCIFFNSKFRFI